MEMVANLLDYILVNDLDAGSAIDGLFTGSPPVHRLGADGGPFIFVRINEDELIREAAFRRYHLIWL